MSVGQGLVPSPLLTKQKKEGKREGERGTQFKQPNMSQDTALSTLITLTNTTNSYVLPIPKELNKCRTPLQLSHLLIQRHLLLPFNRRCPKCKSEKQRLNIIEDDKYTDGFGLRCHKCKGEWSVRNGSIFHKRRQPLSELVRELRYIEIGVNTTFSSKLSTVHFDTSSSLYRKVREEMWLYMLFHPVMFDEDDVVEIDECYLKMLNQEKDGPQTWIIGMISRISGRVALEISTGHTKEEMRRLIQPHLHHKTITTITDRHLSFNFLEETTNHHWAIKKKTKHGGMWVQVDEVNINKRFEDGWGETSCLVHTNTIEGFWAHFRRELRGVQKNTLHLYAAEIMFRRLKKSIVECIHTSECIPRGNII